MKSRMVSLRALFALASLGALGCASEKDALEKRVSSLQEELIAVQNSNDRLAERLMAIELRQTQAPAAAPKSASAGEPEADDEGLIERPPLKVVRLAPGGRTPSEAAVPAEESEDNAPRPVIRDLGSGKKARSRASSEGVRQTEGRTDKASGDF